MGFENKEDHRVHGSLQASSIIGTLIFCLINKYFSKVKSSGAMEVFALKSLLNFLMDSGVTISTLVTGNYLEMILDLKI